MEWSMVKLSVTLEKLGEEDGMEEKMGNEFLNIHQKFWRKDFSLVQNWRNLYRPIILR